MPAVFVLWVAGGWLFTMLALPGGDYVKLDQEQHAKHNQAADEHFQIQCAVCHKKMFQCERITTDRKVLYRICRKCLDGE